MYKHTYIHIYAYTGKEQQLFVSTTCNFMVNKAVKPMVMTAISDLALVFASYKYEFFIVSVLKYLESYDSLHIEYKYLIVKGSI